MKRLLSIFALFVALGVKGQVVGGYIPKNSSQSFTAGYAVISGSVMTPTIVGGTGTTSSIYFKSTTGNGTTSAVGFRLAIMVR
jgi:hypothetical protein